MLERRCSLYRVASVRSWCLSRASLFSVLGLLLALNRTCASYCCYSSLSLLLFLLLCLASVLRREKYKARIGVRKSIASEATKVGIVRPSGVPMSQVNSHPQTMVNDINARVREADGSPLEFLMYFISYKLSRDVQAV